ncbi:hypothetical protein [Borrelia crocidurae]|nr:hypothetical protein [Borrelia crocidurae]
MMKLGMRICAIYFVLSVLFFSCRQSRFAENGIQTLSKLKYNQKPRVIIDKTSPTLLGATLPLGGSSEVVSRPSGGLEEDVLDTRNKPQDLLGVIQPEVPEVEEVVIQPEVPAVEEVVIQPEVPAVEEVVQPKETHLKERVKKYYEQDGKYENKFDFTIVDREEFVYEELKTREDALKKFKDIKSLFLEFYYDVNFDSKPYNAFSNGASFPNLVFSEIFSYNPNLFNLRHPIKYVYLAFSCNGHKIYWLAFAAHKIYSVYKESRDYKYYEYKEACKKFIDRLSDMTTGSYYYLNFNHSLPYSKGRGIDKKNFETKATLEDLSELNKHFVQYMNKMKEVVSVVMHNVYKVIHSIFEGDEITAEDFYKIFDKMNNDADIQKGIDIVIKDKEKMMAIFKEIVNRVRLD